MSINLEDIWSAAIKLENYLNLGFKYSLMLLTSLDTWERYNSILFRLKAVMITLGCFCIYYAACLSAFLFQLW